MAALARISGQDLLEEIVEKILLNVSSYSDFRNFSQVSTFWREIARRIQRQSQRKLITAVTSESPLQCHYKSHLVQKCPVMIGDSFKFKISSMLYMDRVYFLAMRAFNPDKDLVILAYDLDSKETEVTANLQSNSLPIRSCAYKDRISIIGMTKDRHISIREYDTTHGTWRFFSEYYPSFSYYINVCITVGDRLIIGCSPHLTFVERDISTTKFAVFTRPEFTSQLLELRVSSSVPDLNYVRSTCQIDAFHVLLLCMESGVGTELVPWLLRLEQDNKVCFVKLKIEAQDECIGLPLLTYATKGMAMCKFDTYALLVYKPEAESQERSEWKLAVADVSRVTGDHVMRWLRIHPLNEVELGVDVISIHATYKELILVHWSKKDYNVTVVNYK